MKNIPSKTKRMIITGCLCVVCVILVAAIYTISHSKSEKDDRISASGTVLTEATLNTEAAVQNESTEKKDEIVVKPVETDTTQIGTPLQNLNETEQTNTPQSIKPTPPEKPKVQGDATDQSKPPEYKPEDTTVTKPSEPMAGEKKDGKIYVPGYGWIKDEGGGGEGTVVDGDGDIDKQVGSMD